MSRVKAVIERVETSLVDDVERAVRASGGVPFTRLVRGSLSPMARVELEQKLVERGLERGPKAMRVPLEEQIDAAMRGGARVVLKDLAKRVKGTSKKELDATLGRLLREGKARVVVRTQVEVLVGPRERALGTEELAAMKKVSEQLAKALKKVFARGRQRSLLREDVEALFEPIALELWRQPNSIGHATQNDADSSESNGEAHRDAHRLVGQTMRDLEDPKLKLVRIPDLVRALESRFSTVKIHRVLLEAAESGTIELRPDAGTEFLKPEDAALCPPGPRGTVLSYARRLC